MSLLWIEAAWYNAKPGTQEWGEHGFGHESREQRRDRYVQHVQQAHGVDRDTALGAIQEIVRHRSVPVAPFASTPGKPPSGMRLPEEVDFKEAWDYAPVEHVDLRKPVHASQNFLHQHYLEHNLFHPGEVPPREREEVGHPDASSNDDPDDEDYQWHTDASENGPRDLPRLIRQTDGSHVVVDGHHRMATELLLNKPTTQARVLDIRHLSGRLAPV
jgi:hypothetical protein